MTRLLKTQPDLIDIGNVDPAARALFVKQAREMGFKGPMYLITPDLGNLKSVAGWDNCEGLYFLPYETELTEGQKYVEKEYIKRYGEENWIGSLAYLLWGFYLLAGPGFRGQRVPRPHRGLQPPGNHAA